MGRQSLFILALVAACSLAAGVTVLECSCSPSKRGYRRNVLTELMQSRSAIKKLSADLWKKAKEDKSVKPAYVTRKVSEKALALWNGCISNWNKEECVNADVQLRICEGKCDRDSFCKFDPNTWKNILDGQQVPGCDESPTSSSKNDKILKGLAKFKTPVRPSNSPTPSPSRNVALPIPTRKPVKTPKPGDSDAKTPGTNTTPAQPNTNETNNTTGTVPVGSATPFPGVVTASTEPEFTPIAPSSVNEGCVAVEHLTGFILQHRTHLLRPVLCADGFCATPNHAIIVHGQWTSMKRMCGERWNCVRSVKLVNNLKVAANRRARVNERIVVTPYDIRFPIWGVWIVQIFEDIINLVGVSMFAGGFAALALLLAAKVPKKFV